MLLGKLGKGALKQIEQVIRTETREEFRRIVTPAFMETMTKGREDLERILDVVIGYEDRLADLEKRVGVVEKIMTAPAAVAAVPPEQKRRE